jgi:hypothetical protein
MAFNSKDHSNIGEIRPRFRLITTCEPNEVVERLENITQSDDTVLGRKIYDVYYLDIPIQNRHYWSPELRVSIEKNEYLEGTYLYCVVGPRQSVWLLFVFIYSFLGMVTMFGGLYGLAQWDLGKPTIWIWCLPIMLMVILGVYVTAKTGQKKGRDQMLHLVSVLYHALGESILVRK